MLTTVMELVSNQAPPADLQALTAFAEAYIRRFPDNVGVQLTGDECYRQIHYLFDFVKSRPDGAHSVRVFTPVRATHGYETGGSVVELVVDDSPFLVDSMTAEIQSRGMAVQRALHPVIGVDPGRNRPSHRSRPCPSGSPPRVGPALRAGPVNWRPKKPQPCRRHSMASSPSIHAAVRDFDRISRAVDRMVGIAEAGRVRYPADEIYETTAFLRWLLDGNFVFLGFREYRITGEGEERALSVVPGSGLGILADHDQSAFANPVLMSELDDALRRRYEEGGLLVITKTNRLSTIHRRVKMDYIGIRHLGPDGEVIGEARLVGLFTSKMYMTRATQIPLLHRKLDQIIESEDLIEGSHDHKLAIQLFESFPKDELFATPTDDIQKSIAGLLTLEDDQHVKLFVRRDLLNRNVSSARFFAS